MLPDVCIAGHYCVVSVVPRQAREHGGNIGAIAHGRAGDAE
jgi:hypothetical protein